ncbi:MAG: vWA domain-containing protein [Polyangiaceae bacterium]
MQSRSMRRRARPDRTRNVFKLFTMCLALAGPALGCAQETDTEGLGAPQEPEVTGVGDGGGGATGGEAGPCEEGALRGCKVDHGTHGGVHSCFEGVQVCVDGEWSTCGEAPDEGGEMGAVDPAPPPPGGGAGGAGPVVLAAAGAAACADNACDPSCQELDQVPPGGVTATPAGSSFDWQSGSLGDLPGGLAQKGEQEPCDEGSDCQFDQACSNPASGTCAHSKCQASPAKGLTAGCDPCVAKVCAADPSCCESLVGPACNHNLCATGGPVKASCDPCAAAICQKPGLSHCCAQNGSWDASCALAVGSVCGKACDAGSWTQSCVDKVTIVCGALCPAPGCGADCGAEGQCTPWAPGEIGPFCPGVDLTAGIACAGPSGVVLPVCNHGATTAPAGVPIAVYPANAGKIPSPSPGAPNASYCFTTAPIPPGQCASVTSCGNVSGNKEIMVNPPGVPGNVSECHVDNNWTISPSTPAPCGAPACLSLSSKTALKKVHLFFGVDRSSSMLTQSWGLPGQPTRWKQLTDAIGAFVTDPKSAGLGVWMRFWPYDVGGACPSPYSWGCNATHCQSPNVPMGDLTSQSAPADAQEQAVLAALAQATPTTGQTPLYPALSGVLSAATAYQSAHPDDAAVVILVTDGEPTQCNTNVSDIAALAQAAYSTTGVRTYAIGIADVSEATIASIANAGGGEPFLVGGGAATPVAAQVLSALQEIRAELVPCSFALPDPSLYDALSMAVTLTSGAGVAQSVGEVSGPAACAPGGWYFDDVGSPARLILCPSTCSAVTTDAGAEVSIHADCPASYLPITVEASYEASCPAGTHVLWSHLAYDTTTPADSKVIFRVATSATSSFSGAAEHVVATAQQSTGTSFCGMGGPAPCPIDLAAQLDLPEAGQGHLRLRAELLPSSAGTSTPALHSWKLTYSCPDAE